MSVQAPGPHDSALLNVLAPDPRTPVANSQEILAEIIFEDLIPRELFTLGKQGFLCRAYTGPKCAW